MNGFEAIDIINQRFTKFEKGVTDKDHQSPADWVTYRFLVGFTRFLQHSTPRFWCFDGFDQLPDVILLDVMMPGMSGYKVAEHLRGKYPTRALPIIMVSCKNEAEAIAIGLKHGANDYISKPFQKVELLARVRTQMQLKRVWQNEMKEAEEMRLLHRVLPLKVTQRLLNGEHLIADEFKDISVLFIQIEDFHKFASDMATPDLILLLNEVFTLLDRLSEKCGVSNVANNGDSYELIPTFSNFS
jgi:adenylate cyclase